jgi:hypothetical protein
VSPSATPAGDSPSGRLPLPPLPLCWVLGEAVIGDAVGNRGTYPNGTRLACASRIGWFLASFLYLAKKKYRREYETTCTSGACLFSPLVRYRLEAGLDHGGRRGRSRPRPSSSGHLLSLAGFIEQSNNRRALGSPVKLVGQEERVDHGRVVADLSPVFQLINKGASLADMAYPPTTAAAGRYACFGGFLGQTRPHIGGLALKWIQTATQTAKISAYIVVGEADGVKPHALLRLPPT